MSVLLSIYSCFPSGGIALSEDKELIAPPKHIHQQTDYQTSIHTYIQQLCQEANKSLKQIDAVCVCVGPGSYTSTRIGLAAAKGIAWSLQKPMITLSSLEIMGHIAARLPAIAQRFICILHARKDTFYTNLYSKEKLLYQAPEMRNTASLSELPVSIPIVGRQEEKKILTELLPINYLSIPIQLKDIAERGHDVMDSTHKNKISSDNIALVEPLYSNAT